MPAKPTSFARGTLEEHLARKRRESFPSYDHTRGESSYPDRYGRIKAELKPFHSAVEKGALLKSAQEWQKSVERQAKKDLSGAALRAELANLKRGESLIYLNNHGEGHVDCVIRRASELLLKADCQLTPYECYLLLCAIQFHDVGNVFGREGHEEKCKEIIESTCKQIIKDATERDTIIRIAMVHGGCHSNDKDTIRWLRPSKKLFNHDVREQLLAAILRFADELADDSSRVPRAEIGIGIVPADSSIYHEYSRALHSVVVQPHSIELGFQFLSPLVIKRFPKAGEKRYLLDEIYDRTLKMERERRYCMRYMRPYISIDQVSAEIVIQSERNAIDQDRITYTLEEKGYPSEPSYDIKQFGTHLRSGKEEMEYLVPRWKLA
jgi:hypothetical protein